ncbi:hypothetical protein C8R45DRAFT_1034549 [Mycena sanguinolenta]|nr:hypothetical protein C8R45DRAFT_1034549 [Mycena sanguinolenta]
MIFGKLRLPWRPVIPHQSLRYLTKRLSLRSYIGWTGSSLGSRLRVPIPVEAPRSGGTHSERSGRRGSRLSRTVLPWTQAQQRDAVCTERTRVASTTSIAVTRVARRPCKRDEQERSPRLDLRVVTKHVGVRTQNQDGYAPRCVCVCMPTPARDSRRARIQFTVSILS